MSNLYLDQPTLDQHDTFVVATMPAEAGRLAVALADCIVRPAGGGQPADHAEVRIDGQAWQPVRDVRKADGRIWLIVDAATSSWIDAPIACRIDGRRRLALSQAHSLIHLALATLRDQVSDGFASHGAEIWEDAATIVLRISLPWPLDATERAQFDQELRSRVLAARPIRTERFKSVEAARAAYPYFRQSPDLSLRGRIRLIHIEGLDANPCSGTHTSSTAAIGPFSVLDLRKEEVAGRFTLTLRLESCWKYWYEG